MKSLPNSVRDFSEALSRIESPEAAWTAFDAHVRDLGGASAIYGFFSDPRGQPLSAQIRAFSSHPEEFSRLYLQEGFIDHDPLAHYCMVEERKALVWGDVRAEHYATPKTHIVAHAQIDVGMKYGITMPLRDASARRLGGIGIALDVDCEKARDDLLAGNQKTFELISALFHARVMDADMVRQVYTLSPRERECLLWASTGMTNKEIAFRISISEKTVEHHMKLAAVRLDARNRTHAVARALIFDLIFP